MGFIATALFICLFFFGPQVLGYADDVNIQIALFATFVFGVLAGYRARS